MVFFSMTFDGKQTFTFIPTFAQCCHTFVTLMVTFGKWGMLDVMFVKH